MKKLLFSFAVLSAVALSSSCDKGTCYECTHSQYPSCKVDICSGAVTETGSCGLSGQGSNTNEEIKDSYEANGYNCTAK